MTIKKRLFLSNILMIVIPACLGVLAVAAALLLFLTVLLPQSGSTWLSQHDVAETRSELVSLAEDWLSEADPAQQTALAARLEKTAAAHQMVLVIRQDGGEAGRFGQGAATDQPGLTQTLSARCIPPGGSPISWRSTAKGWSPTCPTRRSTWRPPSWPRRW